MWDYTTALDYRTFTFRIALCALQLVIPSKDNPLIVRLCHGNVIRPPLSIRPCIAETCYINLESDSIAQERLDSFYPAQRRDSFPVSLLSVKLKRDDISRK